MKKLIGILCSIMLMGSSCDSDCNDCGPTGYTRFYIQNSANENVKLYWFGNTTVPTNIAHEFVITVGERLLLYESSLTGTSGTIGTPPFDSVNPYDSIKRESTSMAVIYSKDDCNLTGNLLCEENYKLINSVDTKDQKIKEWEFEIE